MSVGIISHALCAEHDMGEAHPECPARLTAIQGHFERSGLEAKIQHFEAKSIDVDLLSLAHDTAYINYLFDNAPSDGVFRLDPDTAMNPKTLAAVLLAAGAAVQAVDLVIGKEGMDEALSAVFCATRPPGHHAERGRAMGFCYFNNVAIAAAYARQRTSFRKLPF